MDTKRIGLEMRAEKPGDYRETETVVREAFWNHFVPGCDEHYLVHIMRDSPAFVPQLDVVAILGDRIVGNVMYMKTVLRGDNGTVYEVLSLGSIAVLPEYQGRGVGGRLIARTKELARDMGYRAVFLYGDPEYYSRQGFVPAEQFGIRTADDMYAAAHQTCPLYQGALDGLAGRYVEDAVYEVDADAAAAFDKGFPEKEIVRGTPSQLKFQKIVAMRKAAF